MEDATFKWEDKNVVALSNLNFVAQKGIYPHPFPTKIIRSVNCCYWSGSLRQVRHVTSHNGFHETCLGKSYCLWNCCLCCTTCLVILHVSNHLTHGRVQNLSLRENILFGKQYDEYSFCCYCTYCKESGTTL